MNEMLERKSVRAYTDEAVSDEQIRQIIDCARMAPSGDNTQPWRFIVVRKQAIKEAIVKVDNNQRWLLDAPVFVVCLLDGKARLTDKTYDFSETTPTFELKQMIRDTSIAIDHMLLEAQHLGLGTCWTAWFEQKPMKEVLKLPTNTFVVGVVSVGHAKYTKQKPRGRKSLDEILFYEEYNVE